MGYTRDNGGRPQARIGHRVAVPAPPGRAVANGHGGVLLVGNLPDGPLVGGVEVGVDMLLNSDLRARHAIRLFNTSRRHDPSRSLRQRLAYQSGRFAAFVGALWRGRPRVVHVKSTVGVNYWQGAGYCAIARALGRRVLLQLHGGDLDSWYAQHDRAGRLAVRATLRLPSEILVLSEYWRSFVATLRPGRPIRIVPNGVRIEDALPRRAAARAELVVLTLGALGLRKGHFDILDAAALLCDRPVRFVFAGADEVGGEERTLRERARVLGIAERVTFAGAVTGPSKWALLAESNVFLLPSRGENMPNAVLEAMAAGLPVVCTRVGAMPEMLGDGALYVPAGDAGAIAAALERLLDAADLRAQMGRTNRQRAEARYAFAAVARTLDALYSEGGA